MVNKQFLLVISSLGLFALSGCQFASQSVRNDDSKRAVTLRNCAQFPAEMVGIWENRKYGWILQFEKSGRLSKLRHTIGRRNIAAGERSEFPLVDGGTGFVEPGPWQIDYDASTRELIVDIVLDSFDFSIPLVGRIAGNSRDIFIGNAPAIGDHVWRAQWITKPEYFISTADGEYQDHNLPFEAGDEDNGVIEFTRVHSSEIEQ